MEAQMNNAGLKRWQLHCCLRCSWIFILSYIIQPIHYITRSARSGGGRHLDVAVLKSIKRNDELGQLATAFDLMRKTSKLQGEIETYNRNLIESNEE